MTRLLAVGVNVVVVAFLLTVHAVLLFAHRPLDERPLPEAAPLVIVLDAGARYTLGIRLIEEGRSNWIHFSSGEALATASLARMMADRAQAALPEATVTAEERSLTTLQNAYYTAAEIGPIPPGGILVTDAGHLFRAWLSFTWAGARGLHLAPSTDWAAITPSRQLEIALREAVAVWLTAGRIAVFSSLRLLGHDPGRLEPILAQNPLA